MAKTFLSGSRVDDKQYADVKQQLSPVTFNARQKSAMAWKLEPLCLSEATAAADDTTPSVANINVLKIGANSGGTAITQLDGAIAGQLVTIIITSATNSSTIADSGNFKLSAAFNPNADDTITLYTSDGTTWYELSRSAN
tara:strand:- start:281 stop:700 length:420 start_codon:yes stop_codon:yes gene_type:complete